MGKVYFDNEGNVTEKSQEEEVAAPKKKSNKKSRYFDKTAVDVQGLDKKWFERFPDYNDLEEIKELKDAEQTELSKKCTACLVHEAEIQTKNNPSDVKWLETALHKGTAKDRANAGALLVQSNPIPNLKALETLIGQTKVTNKSSPEVIEVLAELFMNSLIPLDRKLKNLVQRGNDWKKVKSSSTLLPEDKNRIFAYWQFEEQLKDFYYAFLQNLQGQLLSGKEPQKASALRIAATLLMHGPEREAYLLNILVNKLGDPESKVASKAVYRLSQVLYKHPNMAGVIIVETEKLLFRNNISQSAQHFALSFLANVARYTEAENSQRLLKICFSFFKIKTEQGDVNTKTMKLILLCIRTAVGKSEDKDLIPEETMDVIYKLIYLSEIGTALQALAVLLQVVCNRPGGHDRFYNALYRKIIDPALAQSGPKVASLFFHIVHRAILNDRNVPRAQAFLKRLLQAAVHFPSAKICGVLVLIHKILKARAPLLKDGQENTGHVEPKEESSEDEGPSNAKSSWVHVKNQKNGEAEEKPEIKEEKVPAKYDANHRSAAFAGAQFTKKFELVTLMQHFHPSVKLFAEQVILHKAITYYGDPLKDFSLSTFLDRFSFKNPKKADTEKKRTVFKSTYCPQGSRGISVHNLTRQNCTEDEKFIFEFLEQKRDRRRKFESKVKKEEEDDDEDLSETESVDDDEFNEYLDQLGAAKENFEDDDEDIDFMKELGHELVDDKKQKKGKKSKKEEEEDDDDWGDEEMDDDDDELDVDSDGSLSMDENDLGSDEDDDEEVMTFSDSDEEPSTSKKRKGGKMSDKEFNKRLKNANPESLFAAADDFAEMLDEAGKAKGHGTGGELFNKDRSSDKQLAWEQSKMKQNGAGGGGGGKGKRPFQKFGNKKPQRGGFKPSGKPGKKFNKKRK